MAVDLFLKIDGMTGEAKDATHGGEIEVSSWRWAMSESGTMHVGGGGGHGKVAIQNIIIKKALDKATPNLMRACCNGQPHPEAILTARKAGGNPLEYFIIKMTHVIITRITAGAALGISRPLETVTLNFTTLCIDYQPQALDGSADGGTICYGWDIAANTAR